MNLRKALATVVMLAAASSFCVSQQKGVEREYAASANAVKAALQNLDAYHGSRLPSLQGFANVERVHLDQFERPYYEYKIEVTEQAPGRTTVRVRANVSAWHLDSAAGPGGYQAFESNGHLENDLLDRLAEYLVDKSSDPALLSQRIAAVHQQREEAEKRILDLEEQLERLRHPAPAPDYIAIHRQGATVLGTPAEGSAVLLHPQPDDAFQVLERRGRWLKIGLEDGRSGWVRSTDVQADSAPTPPVVAKPQESSGFTIVREQDMDFTGEWATLKDKKALYIFVRPESEMPNVESGKRLGFVENIFVERFRQASHATQNSIDGIVVVFLDQQGAVAAASLDDIRRWVAGSLSHAAFLKKCSLDPRVAFGEKAAPTPKKRPSASKSNAEKPEKGSALQSITSVSNPEATLDLLPSRRPVTLVICRRTKI